MRSAFTAGPRKMSCTYPTDAGERRCTGAFEIQYAATLILTPDPNDACEDPAIKAIWNRTLEFPIRFTISPGR